MKRCCRCKKTKLPDNFHKRTSAKDGLNFYCKECDKEKQKIWRKGNREKLNERTRKWRQNPKNKLRNKELSKKWREKLRIDVISHYSKGKMECICCNEKEFKFLTVDHINNDGKKHRLSYSKHRNGGGWLTALRARNYPKGFQILCYNCNCSKGKYGQCPHKSKWRETK